MRQSKQVKPRKCRHCNQTINTDAAGIKEHARKCANGKS